MKESLFVIGVLMGVIACSSPKSLQDNSLSDYSEATLEEVIAALDERKATYEWFAAKGKAKIESPEENVRGLFYMRMLKDSIIWMLFKKNSVEASRILIRPDSFFVIFRLDQQYKKGSILEIEEELKIDFSFANTQEMLVGNALIPDADKAQLLIEDNGYRMEARNLDLFLTYWISGSDLLLERAKYGDQDGREISIVYSDYKEVKDNGEIPYIREYEIPVEEGQKAYFKLEFTKIAFEKTNIPSFSIPAHYQEVD